MLHIDLPTQSQIDRLVNFRGGIAISFYLRTNLLTQDTKADRINLKNLLKTSIHQLEEADLPKRDIGLIRQAVDSLIEDEDFWAEQANSLAIFVTPETIQTFRLPNKLSNMVEVSDRFHLKPLLRSLTFPHNAFVLAVSIGSVRLLDISADLPPHEITVPGLPRDFGHALGKRSHVERDGDMRSGEGTSEHAMLSRYARMIDKAIRPVISGNTKPLIIAAAEPLASIFRTVSSYPHIPPHGIVGSPDKVMDHVLSSEARSILDKVYAQQIFELREIFAERKFQGRATNDLAVAARAATFGAIDTLIVDMDYVVSGTVSDDNGMLVIDSSPDAINYGIIDEITRRVLQAGGQVVSAREADVPGDCKLAALLRYPM